MTHLARSAPKDSRSLPSKRIVHRIMLLFTLLVAAIVGNALYSTVWEDRILERQVQRELDSKLAIAHSVFEGELEGLRIVTEVVRDRSQTFSEYLDYDSLPPIASILRTLGVKFKVDRILLYGEDHRLLVSNLGLPGQGEEPGEGLVIDDTRERLGIEAVRAALLGGARPKDAELGQSDTVPCLTSVVPLLHDTGSIYGHIMLLRFIHDRVDLAKGMRGLSGAEILVHDRGGRVVLSSFGSPGAPIFEQGVLRTEGKTYFVAGRELQDYTGATVAELSVAMDRSPYLARRTSHLMAVGTPFLVSLVISGWLSLLVKRRVFDRVQVMVRFLRGVAGGRESVSARLPVPATSDFSQLDEIDFLWMDFNDMMDRLETSYDQVARAQQATEAANAELEHRVAERTSKLAEANEQLRREMEAHHQAEQERRQLERKLAHAQKMEAIGTLAGGVAHDLNNILAGVVTYPELILRKISEDSPLRNPLMTVQRSGERAAAVVQDLLTLARRGVAVSESVDLNQVVLEYVDSPEHERLLRESPKVSVETELAPGSVAVAGSTVHLAKALMNLVANGMEAMPEGGRLRIATSGPTLRLPPPSVEGGEGLYVSLSVEDEGVGIAPEDLDRIFDPFYTKKKMGRSGTGLGMAVVWGTVEDHHGFIDAHSELGKGSRFVLWLPALEGEGASATRETVECQSGDGEAILVVDDAAEQREITAAMLEDLGYRAAAVADGEAAVQWVREHRPDLVVLDMIMAPGPNGLETYQRILQVVPDQRVIIVSGFSESADVREAQRLGAGPYVRKPYSRQVLGKAVRAELDRAGGRRGTTHRDAG